MENNVQNQPVESYPDYEPAPRKRKMSFLRFLILLMLIGLAMMFAGMLMGAKRSVDINLFDTNARMMITPFSFSIHSGRNIAHTGKGEQIYINETDLDAFSSIDIGLISLDVTLKQADYFALEMEYPDDWDIRWEIRNNRLIIEDKTFSSSSITSFSLFNRSRGNWSGSGQVTVYSPGIIDDSVTIKTVSGGIEINDYHTEKMQLESISGKIKTKDSGANTLRANTVSGSIDLKNSWGNDIRFESISGSVDFQTDNPIDKYDIQIESISGTKRINGDRISGSDYHRSGNTYTIKAETISGGIDLEFGK